MVKVVLIIKNFNLSLFRRTLNSKLNHRKKKEDRERKEETSHFSIFNQLFPLPFECEAMPNSVMGLGHHPSRAAALAKNMWEDEGGSG